MKYNWINYGDGSGNLEYMGNEYFLYDRGPGAFNGMIEYKLDKSSKWSFYDGTFDEFVEWAENYMDYILSK